MISDDLEWFNTNSSTRLWIFIGNLEEKLNKIPSIQDRIDCLQLSLNYFKKSFLEAGILPENVAAATDTYNCFQQWCTVEIDNLQILARQKAKAVKYNIPNPSPPAQQAPRNFADVFAKEDWKKFIDALAKINPPLLDKSNAFSQKRGAKGILGAWIFYLKSEGIIKDFSRQQLAMVFNSEIKGLALGSDGSLITNEKAPYDWKHGKQYKEQLIKITSSE